MSLATQRFFAGKQLVVFGAGYVGGALVRRALAGDAKVVALTHNPATAGVLRGLGAEVIEADLAGSDWHGAVPDRVDLALNCVSSGRGGSAGYRHSYVEGMRSIVAWAGSARVGTLVYTSSTSVYPQGDDEVVTEDSPVAADRETSRLLLEAEDLLRSSEVFDRWFILRLAGIYGPGRHYLLDQLRVGQPVAGTGAHRLNLAHRDDICAAIEAAFMAPAEITGEILNVADDNPTPKAEVVRWLAEATRLPPPRFDPMLPSRSVPDRVISNARIKQILGWRPEFPDFGDGYRQILAAL